MQTEKIIERTNERDTNAKVISSQQYLHTPQAAAVVPFWQAFISGMMTGLAVFGVMQYFRVRDAWVIGLLVWLVVQAIVWFAGSLHWFTLTNLEKLTGIDINGDGKVGDGKSKVRDVKVTLREVTQQGHVWQSRNLYFPGDPDAIVMLATALLGGASIAERVWSGEGKLFSQQDFRAIRKILEDNRLIEPKNPKDVRQGYQLTAHGVQTMTSVRDTYSGSAPSPTEL